MQMIVMDYAKRDGAGSFSRGGGALSYSWVFDQNLLELHSGSSLDAKVIELKAVNGVEDNKTILQLVVTDQNGFSSTASIPVLKRLSHYKASGTESFL